MAGWIHPAMIGPARRNTWRTSGAEMALSSGWSAWWTATAFMTSTCQGAAVGRRAHSSRCWKSAGFKPKPARTAVVTRSHVHGIAISGVFPTVIFTTECSGPGPAANPRLWAAYILFKVTMTTGGCGYVLVVARAASLDIWSALSRTRKPWRSLWRGSRPDRAVGRHGAATAGRPGGGTSDQR